MKLWILSDLHMEFGDFVPPNVDADLLILAGDTNLGFEGVEWAKKAFDLPVLMLLGNHEYYHQTFPRLIRDLKKACQGSNITILENNAITIGDVAFLGCTLWTKFDLAPNSTLAKMLATQGMNDYRTIRVFPEFRRLQPSDTIAAHEESVDWLGKACFQHKDQKKVILTHHAPSWRSVSNRVKHEHLAPAYASHLDGYIEEWGAELWIHGHIHVVNDYIVGKTRVISNPRGYVHAPVAGFDPSLVIEV